MPFSTLRLGRMEMREDSTVAETGGVGGDRGLVLAGQESVPRLSAAAVRRRREDFLTLPGQFLPIAFTEKDYLNGYYEVEDANGTIEDWDGDLVVYRWSTNLRRIGTEFEIDIESRLSGALTRFNNFSVVGERTHAPAIGHAGYWTDATVTTAVTRTTAVGPITVYRGFNAEISPRWACAPQDYLNGRVMFLDELRIERAGDSARIPALGWELNNGLVRVRPLAVGGVLEVAAYTGGAWRAKAWDVLSDTVTVGTFQFCSIMNNQPEVVGIRLMKTMNAGRMYLDLVLRRGYRFVELYAQREYGSTLKVQRATAEASTNALAGTVVATANDADGNKFIVGSSRTFVADIAQGGISIAATPVLDAFIGVVAGGTSAVSGDQAADLQKQYIGAPTELVQGVRR